METLIASLVFFAILALIAFLTRKRADRRYPKRPPSRADADKDAWGWPG
ncbi:MAG: hypothetical protein KatS3mg011_0528 [Acidimicrobiia bacterium]|nr:MAG: hypothetical protein KatS3mg011_0528 [Acidimicrobiia bacterium]